MRITVEIDADTLKEIQQATGERMKSPAIAEALKQYVTQRRKARIIRAALNGETDYSRTNEELESLAHYDAD
jgi:metal-responsive CopG/Arc/MetJ family transcriptional regulator